MRAMGRPDFCPIKLPTTATLCINFGIYCMYYIYHWHVVNKMNLNLPGVSDPWGRPVAVVYQSQMLQPHELTAMYS